MSDPENRRSSTARDPKVIPASRFISPLTNLLVGLSLPFLPDVPSELEPLKWIITGLLLASPVAWLARKEWSFYLIDLAVGLALIGGVLQGNWSWLVSGWIWVWVFLANRGLHGEILRKRKQLEAERPGSSKGWWPEVF